MAKAGKISSIKREPGSSQTLENSLLRAGRSRIPGTGTFKFPYKELDGKYRTGLDPDASYIERIQNSLEKEVEKERVTKLKEKFEKLLDVNLGPRSEFWNYAKSSGQYDTKHVVPVKLMDGDNYYDFTSPIQELTFAWLRVHPTIAASMSAYDRGEYPADTQFFVSDDDIESAVTFKKKELINKAVVKLDGMTPDKKRKVARQLGLPVTEDSKDELVYNLIDNYLKGAEKSSTKTSVSDPVRTFNQYADMRENLLVVKDIVKQAITHSIYRVKNGGKIFKGEHLMGEDEDAVVKYLIDEDHQDDLLGLEQELKTKKLVGV